MAFALPNSSPFGTPSHHNPSAGNTPFPSNPFPSSSAPNTGSNPFASLQQPQQGAHSPFATPLQPRTSNVPAFQYPGQDPFSVPAGSSPGGTPFQPKSPFAFQQSSPLGPPSLKPAQPPQVQQPKPKGYRYRSYNRSNENAYQPINSSPLSQPHPKLLNEDMDEEDDTAFDSHVPSSPLGRFPHSSSTVSAGSSSVPPPSAFNFGSVPSRRRPKTPGGDDDFDDAVNPSPLFARRRAQYKSTGPSRRSLPQPPTNRRLPLNTNVSASPSLPSRSSPTSSPPVASLFGARPQTEENPRTAFLKNKFKKHYFSCATKAREKAVRERRRRVEGMEHLLDVSKGDEDWRRKAKGKGRCSDDEMESEDEGEEEAMNDPLFSRFMQLMDRKEQHAYRASFAREVGSSFDPDMEDVSRWEEEFIGPPSPFSPPSRLSFRSLPSPGRRPDIGSSPPRAPTEYEFDEDAGGEGAFDAFADVEDEEVEAYAEEYARAVEQQEYEEYQRHVQDQEVEYQEVLQQEVQVGRGGSCQQLVQVDREVLGQQHVQADREVLGQQQRAYDDTLDDLENIPEDELFGEWNWSEVDGEGMDMS